MDKNSIPAGESVPIDGASAGAQQPVDVKTSRQKRRVLRLGDADAGVPAEEWMLSYADMVTLLLTMFVALILNADFSHPRPGPGLGENRPGIHGKGTNPNAGADKGTGPAMGQSGSQDGDKPGAGAGGIGPLNGSGPGDGQGLKGLLEGLFNMHIAAPYGDEAGDGLPELSTESRGVPDKDAQLAIIKNQDLERIAARQAALASIRTRLVDAHLDQYVSAAIERDGIRLNIPNSILFKLGSAELEGRGASIIAALAPIVANGEFTISVEGHTDNAPIQTDKFPSNWELSAQRAAIVVRTLVGEGLDPKRLEAVGYADTRPIVGNDDEAGRAQNRRVALFLRL